MCISKIKHVYMYVQGTKIFIQQECKNKIKYIHMIVFCNIIENSYNTNTIVQIKTVQ